MLIYFINLCFGRDPLLPSQLSLPFLTKERKSHLAVINLPSHSLSRSIKQLFLS
jgi:hypothetical protein